MTPPPRVVVIGDLEATRLLCTLLTEEGTETIHLLAPDEPSLRTAFAEDVAGVAVIVRGDVVALRYALLAESLQPGRGPRSVPAGHHVVIAGLGQVGLRVGQLLRELQVPCVVVERTARAANLPQARSSRLPVVIGDAADLAVLERVGLPRARAMAALGSDDLDNVAVVISALALSPGVQTVLRAGEDPAVEETTSLFRIGRVADVSAMTAAWVCASVRGDQPVVAYAHAGMVGVLTAEGDRRRSTPTRCRCN